MKKSLTLLTLLLLSVFAGYAQRNKPMQAATDKVLHFRENKGQIVDQYGVTRKDIDFKVSGGKGLQVYIGRQGLRYQWAKRLSGQSAVGNMQVTAEKEMEEVDTYELYRMEVELVGANTTAKMITEGLQNSYERYFQPWVNTSNSNTGVRAAAYAKVTYKDIYPGIDWVLYFSEEGKMEYDFVVHPGGNVANIQLQYSGSDKLEILADGGLRAQSPFGIVQENKPISFTKKGLPVTSRFVLQESVVSFAVADYSGTLTIDPVVEWGSYFGGAADEAGLDVTTDKWGHVYLCGSTSSVANIATTGTHQQTYATGTKDAFVSKWNDAGALLWASYYGGAAEDIAKGIACDTLGNVYFGGNSNSQTGIATVGSAQEVKGGNPAQNRHDAFLVKMDSAGVRQWATYLGGNNQDAQLSFDLTVDQENKVYITGNTLSADLATTAGAHQMTKAGTATTNDAFISKYNSDGTVVWTTYFGGNSHDYPHGITTDDDGQVYLTGYTISTTGLATIGSHQASYAGGDDVFLTKLAGSGLVVWTTYFGDVALDRAYVVRAHGNKIFVGGVTQSTNMATANAHQATFASGTGGDGFLSCWLQDGTLVWSTYYGGDQPETLEGMYINQQSDIYISGQSNSPTGIATAGSVKDVLDNITDVYLAKFDALGSRQWGTYLGGTDAELFGKLAGFEHHLYLSGITRSGAGVATANAYQSSLNGGDDAFLLSFNDCLVPAIPQTISGDTSICAHTVHTYSTVQDTLAASYVWLVPGTWSGNSNTHEIELTASDAGGVLQVVAISACGGVSDTQRIALTVLPIPTPIIVNNNFILSTTQSYTSYQWMRNGVVIPSATNPIHVATEDGDYAVRVTGSNACTGVSPVIAISGTVGVDDKQGQSAIAVYPNPTADKVYIKLKEQAQAILSSIDGSIIIAYRMKVGTNELDLRPYSPGSYLLKVSSSEGQQVFKIVKQ